LKQKGEYPNERPKIENAGKMGVEELLEEHRARASGQNGDAKGKSNKDRR
jgi:hypothetical protein